MTLGIRYIALVPMVQLEHDTDGNRYARPALDADGKPIVEFWVVHHNQRLYEKTGPARRAARAFGVGPEAPVPGRVLLVDLDSLRDVDTPETEHLERIAIPTMARYEAALAAEGRPSPVRTVDRRKMERLAEAARAWGAWVARNPTAADYHGDAALDLWAALVEVLPELDSMKRGAE